MDIEVTIQTTPINVTVDAAGVQGPSMPVNVYVLSSQTGQFASTGALNLTGSFLWNYLNELSGYSDLTFATIQNLSGTGSYLLSEILNLSGFLSQYSTVSFTTGISGLLQSEIDSINNSLTEYVLLSQTGEFYSTSNPSGFITGVDFTPYVLNSSTGDFITSSQTGVFYPVTNPSGYITGVDLSPYALSSQIEAFITTGQTGNFYPVTNPSGYITGVNLTSYVQTGATGVFVTTGQTGNFYPVTNPSGYITVANLPVDLVYTTGDQTIHGDKLFVDDVIIRNLTVTGTQTVVNTQIVDIGTNYVYLNVSGGVRDAGLFIDFSGDPSLGGAMIGWDVPSNTWRIGTGIPNSDLSGLSHIASEEWVTSLNYISASQTGVFYPVTNPSGYITGVNLTSYVQTGATGVFVTTGQTGNFYPVTNPSGYITGVNLTSYVQTGATGNFVTQTSGNIFASGFQLYDAGLGKIVTITCNNGVLSVT